MSLNENNWISLNRQKPEKNLKCIVVAQLDDGSLVTQSLPLVWNGSEFEWSDEVSDFGIWNNSREEFDEIEPFPSELAVYYMPWPKDPEIPTVEEYEKNSKKVSVDEEFIMAKMINFLSVIDADSLCKVFGEYFGVDCTYDVDANLYVCSPGKGYGGMLDDLIEKQDKDA